jgi:hypothetical protein
LRQTKKLLKKPKAIKQDEARKMDARRKTDSDAVDAGGPRAREYRRDVGGVALHPNNPVISDRSSSCFAGKILFRASVATPFPF